MSTTTYQGASWVQLDCHLTAGALRQDGTATGWSARKLAGARRYDRRVRGAQRDRIRRDRREG
jgi:hypothetical protein